MLKIKVEFTLDEDQLRDIFESYDIKFSKKKVAELKKEIKDMMDNSGDFFEEELQSDFEDIIGNIISEIFGE
jgi:hypothetical protein